MPNLIRRVRPAMAAMALMHSRIGWRETSRSVCQSESTPPSSQRSTQRQKARASENGKSASPSPTPMPIARRSCYIRGRLYPRDTTAGSGAPWNSV